MWMKSLICLVNAACLILCPKSLVQDDLTFVLRIPLKSDFVTADPFGNLYSIRENTVSKFNEKGVKTAEFTDRSILRFSSADVSDPLKILLFSKESGEIKRVDNQLSLQGNTLNLHNHGLVSPTLACNSYENGCWVFDQTLFEFIRFNHQGNIDQRTGSLLNLTHHPPVITQLAEHDRFLYATIQNFGVWKFDRYGNFAGRIQLAPGFINCWILQNRMAYTLNDSLIFYDPARNVTRGIEIPVKNPAAIQLEGNKLLISVPDTLFVYHYNNTL